MPVKKQTKSLSSATSNNGDVKPIILVCILLIATIFRFLNLASTPPGVFQDEAVNTMDALNRAGQVFYQANNGREGLFMNLIALSFKLLGPSVFSLRLVSALIGVLTVLGVYLFAKQLFKKDFIALLSSFFCAVSFWHVNFSRISFRVILLPFVLVFFGFFLLKALDRIKEKKDAVREFILAGIFYGMGFYTYTTYRVTALVMPIIILLYWLVIPKNKKEKSSFIQGGLLFTLMVFLTVAPLAIYFFGHPADFIGRSGQVSIFAQASPIKALCTSIFYHLTMYNVAGDCNWRHNVACLPQLSWPIGSLFLIGMIILLWIIFDNLRARSIKLDKFLPHLILLLMFLSALAPAVLTYEGIPHALRTLGTAPFAYIIASFGAWYLISKVGDTKSFKKYPEFFNLLGMLFVLLIAFWEYNLYFSVWANRPQVKSAFGHNYVELARVLNQFDKDTNIYVIANQQNTTYELEGMRFVEFEGKDYDYKPQWHYLSDWNKDLISISEGSPVISVSKLDDNNTFPIINEKIKTLLDEKSPEELTMIANYDSLGDNFDSSKKNLLDLYNTTRNYKLKNFVVIINSNQEILDKIKNTLD